MKTIISIPKMKKTQNTHTRILISVNVVGSAGPIRLIVNKDDVVADVVSMVLKEYSRQGRLPVLGYDTKDFQLLCPAAGFGELDPNAKIGEFDDAISFMLWKKKPNDCAAKVGNKEVVHVHGKGIGAWKTWIRKSIKVAVAAH